MNMFDQIDGVEKLPDDFKLVVYTSYRSLDDTVCLELCEGLRDMNKKLGINNFELVVRLSNRGDARWDKSFILQEIAKYKPDQIKKMWVCGPPVMNENFDKTLSNLVKEKVLNQSQFEVF
eukprot:CAMPEP_0176350822 /NCGR_PEP_ID=MMETSP0126-20121128/9767_1 /TAXON_ID=141414 ORGANISM="Strombidinopsis acuminatum, Strain SPMC142" /NCGR_SAMPLE_ID=MMETSP0126 /ASSEMBLY_ACC=CAM_ASM_000229 /LENGTH=119 /DNA_ID=CAMNT_0017701033 /DNA_START=1186 /DNA_END=1545 /DNA_ORIENTATION=-